MRARPTSLSCVRAPSCAQRKYEEFGLKPYVAHATFQYSGTPGKRHRFREFMLFEDPPAYYDYPEGFINLKCARPPARLPTRKRTHKG